MRFFLIAALLFSAVSTVKVSSSEGLDLTSDIEKMSHKQIEAIFKKYDKNGDGLSWKEFRHFIHDKSSGRLNRA